MIPKAYELIHLDPALTRFERVGDTLALTLPDGTRYPRVVLRCCFPVADESAYLSVRDATLEEQPEIGMLEDWTRLQDADRQAVSAELDLHYFVPQITRVIKIKEEFGFLYWTIETDKGPKEFVMRNSVVHYAREVAAGRWLLIDVNQARFEIRQLDALDDKSQRLIRRYLYL
jgi:hypothetical protein